MPGDLSFEDEAISSMDALYGMAKKLCRNETAAQDLLQETYLKALRFRHTFRPGSSMRAWLYSILRNTFFNELKRDKHYDRSVRVEDTVQPIQNQDNVKTDLGLSDPLLLALEELPEKQRTVILLADVEEWSYEEIGQVMKCPKNTVGTLLARARRSLKTTLIKNKFDH